MDREKNTDGTSAAPETTDGKMPGKIFSGDAARTGGCAATGKVTGNTAERAAGTISGNAAGKKTREATEKAGKRAGGGSAATPAANAAERSGGNAAGEEFEELFARLARSEFRSRFRLGAAEAAYAERKGAETLRRHAEDFVRTRLAPAVIPNDGRQMPMRGHPVFIAQHATACCCRKCLEKWHRIPAGRELSAAEQRYVVAVLMAWIGRQPLRQTGTNRPVR